MRDVCCSVAVAIALCLLLGQSTYHPVDSHRQLIAAERGEIFFPYHFAYVPTLALVCMLGRAVGVSAHTAGLWLSALSAAIGIGLLHLAWLRAGIARPFATALALATLATPAVLYFGTTVEIHAMHFAVSALVLHAVLRFARGPGLANAVVLAICTWSSYLTHATGALVPAWALPLAWMLGRENGHPFRVQRAPLALAGALHAALVAATPSLLAIAVPAIQPGAASAFLHSQYEQWSLADLGLWARTGTREGLLAHAPLMPLALLGLLRRERSLLVVLPSAALLLGVTGVLLGGASENGAYLMPLVGPLGLAVARSQSSLRPVVAGAVLSVGLAVAWIVAWDTADFTSYAKDRDAATAGKHVYLLVGSLDEVAAMLSHTSNVSWDHPSRLWTMSMADTAAALPVVDQWFRSTAQQGTEVWLTDGAIALLRKPAPADRLEGGPILVSHFEQSYVWQRRDHGCFRAACLVPGTPSGPAGR